ncbi:MAG: Gfo/Idh/MocA family oxidoreductase [Chloroflexi bacterium]|nr:Gfo/Idh/MocA family oxidoreductase [Chloroflexota bacterium]
MTLQIGIIGTGGIANAHLEGLVKMDGVKVAGFCDVLAERAAAAAEKYGGKSYQSAAAMLDDQKFDAVWICLPPFAHGDAERQALSHRVPFFVEKPVGLDAGACREIAAEVEKTGILTGVGYMNRYRRSVQRGRDLLRDDPPVLAYGGWIGGSPRGDSWWTTKSQSGGQLVEQTTHTVDLVRYLCGDAEEVFAHGTHAFNSEIPGYDIEDASMVNILCKGGAVVTLMSSCACRSGGGVFLTLLGKSTCLKYTGWEHSLTVERPNEETETIAGEGDIFAIEDARFLEAVRTGNSSQVLCSYPDGWKTAELALAANESMETGKAVRLA